MSTIVVLWIILTAVFMLIHLLPGDPALVILGGVDAHPTEEDIQQVRKELGLDQPLYVQYVNWMSDLAQLDLGTSFVSDQSVSETLLRRVPRTLMIAFPAAMLAVLLGIPLGIAGALLRRTMWDPIISSIALVGFSIPVFVTGIVLVLVFSIQLGWLPSGGYVNPSDDLVGFLKRAALPVLALTFSPMTVIMRMTRSSVVEQLGLDYVVTARSKGVRETVVVTRHVLRNALLPVVTIVGLLFGYMFTGSVLVEFIFNWPGLARLLLQSISQRDYPVMQSIVLAVAVMFVLINFLTDMTYAVLDPRIRYDD